MPIRILCIVLTLVFILILYTFPGWHEEETTDGSYRDVKPFPSRQMTLIALVCSFASSLGLYIAIAWQHIAVATAIGSVKGLRYQIVEVSAGSASVTLAWLSVLLSFICTIGISIMILSIQILTKLTN